jgi:hypothetical protein
MSLGARLMVSVVALGSAAALAQPSEDACEAFARTAESGPPAWSTFDACERLALRDEQPALTDLQDLDSLPVNFKRRLACRSHDLSARETIRAGLLSNDPATVGDCLVAAALLDLSLEDRRLETREAFAGFTEALTHVLELAPELSRRLGTLIRWAGSRPSSDDPQHLKEFVFRKLCLDGRDQPAECEAVAPAPPSTVGRDTGWSEAEAQRAGQRAVWIVGSFLAAGGLTAGTSGLEDGVGGRILTTVSGTLGGAAIGGVLGELLMRESFRYGGFVGAVVGAVLGAIAGGLTGALATAAPGIGRPIFSGIASGTGAIAMIPLAILFTSP